MFLGLQGASIPSRISTRSAVFAGHRSVAERLTDLHKDTTRYGIIGGNIAQRAFDAAS